MNNNNNINVYEIYKKLRNNDDFNKFINFLLYNMDDTFINESEEYQRQEMLFRKVLLYKLNELGD